MTEEKYNDSAIKKLEGWVKEFVRSDAGHQRELQRGDAREYSLWLDANDKTKRPLLETALTEMNEWYPHHPLKDLLQKALA